MNSSWGVPNIGQPPEQYDRQYMMQLVRTLVVTMQDMRSPGDIHVSGIFAEDLPTSTTGLKSGQVWNDAGTLKVVP